MGSSFLHLLLIVGCFNAYHCFPFFCGVNDPCELSPPYSSSQGYGCVERGSGNVLCLCPNGEYEINRRCRLCDRSNPILNACDGSNPRFLTCLEPGDFGTSYACLCRDSFGNAAATTAWNCDLTVTLTSTRTTTTTAATVQRLCQNGGVFVDGSCNCPSGFDGYNCERRNEPNLCERVRCLNTGVPALRSVNGPNECVCLCKLGTSGEYCELNGTSGTCGANSCLNGGSCRENRIGTTVYAYCECAAGFKGPRCETQYFRCPSSGLFTDVEMFDQGKYFECTGSGTSLRAVRRSCPKGLRFNMNRKLCTY